MGKDYPCDTEMMSNGGTSLLKQAGPTKINQGHVPLLVIMLNNSCYFDCQGFELDCQGIGPAFCFETVAESDGIPIYQLCFGKLESVTAHAGVPYLSLPRFWNAKCIIFYIRKVPRTIFY